MPRFVPHPDRRAVIVTGASSGIGRATAEVLAAAGHPSCSRRPSRRPLRGDGVGHP
jgi:NAD(P)-dependent dehydrogenase (short-subunit alcohol dehydrogenase family)